MPLHRKLPYPLGRKGWGASSSGSSTADSRSPGRAIRCAYCRGPLAPGEGRLIVQDGETRYVHERHPRRAEEP